MSPPLVSLFLRPGESFSILANQNFWSEFFRNLLPYNETANQCWYQCSYNHCSYYLTFLFLQKVTELCSTIEECWDKEGDARLSVPGVLHRLKQMQMAAEGAEVDPPHATAINIPPYGDGDSTMGGNSTGVSFLSGSTSSCGKEPLIVDLP